MTATSTSPARSVVVLGAGHAGVQTAYALRQGGWTGRIVLIDEAHHLPYERPPLSKDYLHGENATEAPLLRKAAFYADKGIDLLLSSEIRAIDVAGKAIVAMNGDRIDYDRLVLATGAAARHLAIQGAALSGVQCLRTLDDSRVLKTMLRPHASIVIIGGGYIGLEVAAAAVAAGCKVTLLERDGRLMSRVTSEKVSRHFEELHQSRGVRIVLNASASRIIGNKTVEAVVTDGGEIIPADSVVVGIGVTANDRLAAEAGIACDDGIIVDGCGRTSIPGIYAAGDVTKFYSARGDLIRLECIQNAVDQASAVAAHILSGKETGPAVPWFWTVQYGVRLQSAGLRAPDDDALVRPAAKGSGFSILYRRDGVLAAIDTVDCLADFIPAKKLIASRSQLDWQAATDPRIKLADLAVMEKTE